MPQLEFDYETWSEFRYQLRLYMRTAEAAAREHGIAPQQHQLLLAARGFPNGAMPTIGDLAERLQLRHHSTVELVDRMEQAGLVKRQLTGVGRAVAVRLTPQGRRSLDVVSRDLQPELATTSKHLLDSLRMLVRPAKAPVTKPATPSRAPERASRVAAPASRSTRGAVKAGSTPKPRSRPARA